MSLDERILLFRALDALLTKTGSYGEEINHDVREHVERLEAHRAKHPMGVEVELEETEVDTE